MLNNETIKPKIKFYKKFSKLSVKSICKELNIDPSNLYRGNISQKNIDLVYITIITKMKILVDDVKENIERQPLIK